MIYCMYCEEQDPAVLDPIVFPGGSILLGELIGYVCYRHIPDLRHNFPWITFPWKVRIRAWWRRLCDRASL